MSLTSLLNIPQVRTIFKETFPVKDISAKPTGVIKAPPITKHYALVGTAFDYLLRFFIEKTNNCITQKWICESFMEQYVKMPVWYHKSNPAEQFSRKEADKIETSILESATSTISNAKSLHHAYVNSVSLDDELIKSCIVLARIDGYARIGMMNYSFNTNVDDGDIQDLRNLISLVTPDTFKSEKCYLNPTFGDASNLVGGADADIIMDDMLIDIKTTKAISFTQEHYNQLVGYYILSKLGKINDTDDVDISRLGIYFSRYGVLHTIPTTHIDNNPDFEKFVKTFEDMAQAQFRPR